MGMEQKAGRECWECQGVAPGCAGLEHVAGQGWRLQGSVELLAESIKSTSIALKSFSFIGNSEAKSGVFFLSTKTEPSFEVISKYSTATKARVAGSLGHRSLACRDAGSQSRNRTLFLLCAPMRRSQTRQNPDEC